MSSCNALTRTLFALSLVAVLAGCSTLPRDGPTGRAVQEGAATPHAAGSYAIVDLDFATSERIKAAPGALRDSLAAAGGADAAGGRIGPGDVLAISIFEPGGALFGSGGVTETSVRSGGQTLPATTVDASGRVTIPFAGQVVVEGLTATEAAAAVRRALIGKVGNPQVVVSIAENTFNTVTVLGEIRQPGTAPLSINSNRIVDVIANRGGAARPPEDIEVVVNRNGRTFRAPLAAITSDFAENIALSRGDQINLVYTPRRFSTFGALGAVSQVEMGAGPLNLSGALSKVGGLDTNSANARSVFVFRFERPEVAEALGVNQAPTARGVPLVYRLNLEDPAGFFTANNFHIRPDDVLYVPRSGSAELGKFFTLVRTLTGAIYDVSVTSALNNN